MNTKLKLSVLMLAGSLMVSGAASANTVWSWTGTAADWAAGSVVDGDGDTTFTLDTAITTPGWFDAINTQDLGTVTLKEEEVNGRDLYNVGISWSTNGQTTGTLAYWIQTVDEAISLSALDSVVSGSGVVTKRVYDAATNALLLTLTSTNGSRDPSGANAYASLGGDYQHLYVVDTIISGTVNDIHNEFTVPEPASLSLLGIGAIAAMKRRRREVATA